MFVNDVIICPRPYLFHASNPMSLQREWCQATIVFFCWLAIKSWSKYKESISYTALYGLGGLYRTCNLKKPTRPWMALHCPVLPWMAVVYFDQPLGAVHTKCWLKFFFFFSHLRLSQKRNDPIVGGLNLFVVITLYQEQPIGFIRLKLLLLIMNWHTNTNWI